MNAPATGLTCEARHLATAQYWRRLMRAAALGWRKWIGQHAGFAAFDLRSARRYRDLALRYEAEARIEAARAQEVVG